MISIIYCTNRKEPQFKWFVDSLLNQTSEEDRENIELVFIDYALSFDDDGSRANYLKDLVGSDFKFIHETPKDNAYQGKRRITQKEYFSPSSARNTGFILSSGEYVVFVDDVGVLMPTWWDAVKEAANEKRITCGAYQKHFEMVVEYGKLISSRAHHGGIDSRWILSNNQPVVINGGQLFGCSFGIPAFAFESVNGFDEICDSIGGEDYHLGIRLNHAGYKIWYDKRMLTIESEELHDQDYKMVRDDRLMDKDQYMEKLKQYRVNSRYSSGKYDSSNFILDVLMMTRQVNTIGNNYPIKHCRETKILPVHVSQKSHWFDNKELCTL